MASRETVSTQEGVLLRLREKALKGDARSLDLLVELAQAYNAEELATADDGVLGASDQEIFENYRGAGFASGDKC